MYDIILAFITAFALTYFAIPNIVYIAKKKNLMDEPGERRSHTISTPSLGGIAIFAGALFSIIMWTPFHVFGDLQYILCAFIIIFLVGARDDIIPVPATKKLMAQIFAAGILVFKSNVLITGLHGLFGIVDIPILASYILSIFVILVIINAFNLIDGINGLSGSIGTLIALTFGTWFILIDRLELAILAFTLAGATIAFLKYNITPARIFMGDTGSLLIGLVCAILAIKFIEINKLILTTPNYAHLKHLAVRSVPAVTIGIMILPLFDTLRVFLMRAMKGKSPFQPDRTHIHHLLIDYGYTHMQATFLLVLVNIGFILMVFNMQNIGTLPLTLLVVSLATILTGRLYFLVRDKKIKMAKDAAALKKGAQRTSDKIIRKEVQTD